MNIHNATSAITFYNIQVFTSAITIASIINYFLGRFGILTPAFMRHYRRHAIVVIMIAAAVITPTTDPFTMLVFSVPMLVLYEVSIWVSAVANKKRNESHNE